MAKLSEQTRRACGTVEEAAAVFGISRNAAYAAARCGQIPTIRIGRRLLVPWAAVDRMLAGEGGVASDNDQR